MPRFQRFTFLYDKDDRQLISLLAERLQRSQSDAIRFVIRQNIHQTQNTNQVDFLDSRLLQPNTPPAQSAKLKPN